MTYDLIIVGSGPAGMSAALYAIRQNLRFIMIAKEVGGLANLVPTLKSYLGYPYVTGFDLIDKFKGHLSQYRVDIKDEHVTKIEKSKGMFIVHTDRGFHRSATVIVATGRRFRHLGIPGEKALLNKGVSDCTVCDGPMFKNKTVAVVGGGRTGLFASLFLLKIARKIYIIEQSAHVKTEGGMRQYADILKHNKKVTILTNTKPLEIHGNGFVKELAVKKNNKTQRISLQGVFVEIGYQPNTDFVHGFVRCNSRKEIIIDPECRTNVSGLFAAGDVTNVREKQVVVSVGEGAKAALSAVLYLEQRVKK